MNITGLKHPVKRVEAVHPNLAQEIEDILERAETNHEHGKHETGSWFYRMPSAGVREYFFGD